MKKHLYENIERKQMMIANVSNNSEVIPIVYTPNDRYVTLALTSMVSIAENTDRNLDFIILYSDISEKYMKYLDSITSYPNCKITYKKIDKKIFLDAGALERLPYYTAEVYYKMIIPDVIPDYDKALFFDSDTLCLGDIGELFDEDLMDVSLGAVQDVWFPEGRQELPLRSKCYFNCGSMLYNCKKMRETDFCNRVMASLKDNALMKYSSEEGILNKMLDMDKVALPLKYNYLEPWWNNRINYTGDRLIEYNEAKQNPLMIHFTGYKPNTIHSRHSYREVWWDYAKKTVCYPEIIETFKDDAFNYMNDVKKEIANYKQILNDIKNKVAPYK